MENFNELQREILRLKREKNALVLAHYYVPLAVQDAADAVCDSFAMAQKAARAKEDLIVICGVRFMGESAKILSPEKTVLLPSLDAGCPMADMVTPEDVLRLRAEHPRAQVMCYVNSSAAVKAVSDVCCTSSSALRIAKDLDCEEIIFVPDKHLGSFVARHVPEKKFWLHPGFCPTHHKITEADVLAAEKAHPDAEFAVHPECAADVVKHGDLVGSTAEILDFARKTDAPEILIGTESEIVERLRRELPEKKIYGVGISFVCPNMKKVTPEALYECLRDEKYKVELPEDQLRAARRSLDRMVNS